MRAPKPHKGLMHTKGRGILQMVRTSGVTVQFTFARAASIPHASSFHALEKKASTSIICTDEVRPGRYLSDMTSDLRLVVNWLCRIGPVRFELLARAHGRCHRWYDACKQSHSHPRFLLRHLSGAYVSLPAMTFWKLRHQLIRARC